MLKTMRNVSLLVRATVAFASAAFWALCAYDWNAMGAAGPGQSTVFGVAVLALASAVGGLIALLRLSSTPRPIKRPERENAETASACPTHFDPDAIIARYLSERTPPRPEHPEDIPLPPRPTFGRKRSD